MEFWCQQHVLCVQQISSHGLLDITVEAKGDTWIDDHHTVEDIALAFGGALSQALGDRKGIYRFGDFSAPLDEALIHVVLVPRHPLECSHVVYLYCLDTQLPQLSIRAGRLRLHRDWALRQLYCIQPS